MIKEVIRDGQGAGDPQRPPKVDPTMPEGGDVSVPGLDGQGQVEVVPPSQVQATPQPEKPKPIPSDPQFIERTYIPPHADEEPEQVAEEPQQQVVEPADKIGRENFLKETGFKSYSEAYKSLKEGQATITKKSQREKQLEQDLKEKEELLTMYSSQPPPVQAGQGEEEIDIFEDPKAIDRKVETVAQRTWRNMKMQEEIAEVRGEDPTAWDFLVRGQFINEAFTNKPYLNQMGVKGLRQAKADAIVIMRDQSQTVENIMKQGSANPQQPVQPRETEEQMRQRLLSEKQDAIAATLPQGGTARGIQRDRKAEKQAAIDKNDPFALAEVILEGMP